jgi:hypothetical protein
MSLTVLASRIKQTHLFGSAQFQQVRQHQNIGGAEDAEDAQVRQQKITRRCSG